MKNQWPTQEGRGLIRVHVSGVCARQTVDKAMHACTAATSGSLCDIWRTLSTFPQVKTDVGLGVAGPGAIHKVHQSTLRPTSKEYIHAANIQHADALLCQE
jgi:hypothetical protein